MAHLSQEYHDYIQSDAWQQKRLRVLKRDGSTCRKCGKRGTDVHHLTYERFGNERLSDLETLCRSCHKSEHKDNSVFIGTCQTCGQVLLMLKQRLVDGWIRFTCSDGHIREYRKGEKR